MKFSVECVGHNLTTTHTSTGTALGYADQGGGVTEVRFTLLGDTNLDGSVNVGDLGALATNYGATAGVFWQQGDFNNDGAVNVGDLGALATNYGGSLAAGSSAGGGVVDAVAAPAATASVPEPASIALAGLGMLVVRLRRIRRRWRAPRL